MTIAVIGADEESVHAIRQAKQMGYRVVAVDQNPKAKGIAEADVWLNIDISDEEKVIEALKEEKIELVLTAPIGRHIRTIGAVNDALGLPGISKETAIWCSDKYSFHNRLRNKKLREGHCYMVNEKELFNPSHMTFPAVFKPRFGSHGRSVHYLENSKQLAALEHEIWGEKEEEKQDSESKKEDVAAFAKRIKQAMAKHHKAAESEDDPKAEYILEDAFKGNEYAVDAVLEGCNFEIVMLRKKLLAKPPYRQAIAYLNVLLDEEPRVVSIIKDYMTCVCEAMKLSDCILHADVMVFGRNCVAIEVSASPAGHHVYDEFIPMSTGIDMCAQYLTYMSGDIHNFQPLHNRKTMMHYFDMENCFVHKIPSLEEVKEKLPEKVRVRKWICNMKMLDYMGPITDELSLLGRGYYILEGTKDSELLEAADIIMNEFELK